MDSQARHRALYCSTFSAYETLIVKRTGDQGNIVVISLNRPETYNAVNMQMLADLRHVFETMNHDNTVNVAILDGGCSKHFCCEYWHECHQLFNMQHDSRR